MSDLGAEVIKVEPPGGDPYRGLVDIPGMPESDVNYPRLLCSIGYNGAASRRISWSPHRGSTVAHP